MKKRSVFERFSGSPYIIWSALFIIAPLVFVMYFAFTDRSGSFTFENILSLSSYSETFVMSLGFSLIATTICLIIGFPLAYVIFLLIQAGESSGFIVSAKGCGNGIIGIYNQRSAVLETIDVLFCLHIFFHILMDIQMVGC